MSASQDKLQKAMFTKVVYVGKDGITLKQAVLLAKLGFRVIWK